MKINCNDVSIEITPQEINDLVEYDLMDQIVSIMMLLGMSPEDLLDEDLVEGIPFEEDTEDISDKERIKSLFKNFRRFTTDDDKF